MIELKEIWSLELRSFIESIFEALRKKSVIHYEISEWGQTGSSGFVIDYPKEAKIRFVGILENEHGVKTLNLVLVSETTYVKLRIYCHNPKAIGEYLIANFPTEKKEVEDTTTLKAKLQRKWRDSYVRWFFRATRAILRIITALMMMTPWPSLCLALGGFFTIMCGIIYSAAYIQVIGAVSLGLGVLLTFISVIVGD